ncbi:hypothetical protein GGR50DRAFT_80281 [Xylaria sp. CBS 124048]|nr:hypothetical protein GGR50DRAFT_80281 [Xylaria sp. CBS 124048]
MSAPSFTCIRCTRRLSRLAQTLQTSRQLLGLQQVQQAASPPSRAHIRFPGVHQVRSASSSGHKRVKPSPTSPLAKTGFTVADIPRLEFWRTWARPPLVRDLSAEDCLATAVAYTQALRKGTPGWERQLIAIDGDDMSTIQSLSSKDKVKPLSAHTLYYIALLLILHSSGRAWQLARHIHHTLADMDHVPSILVLMQMDLQKPFTRYPKFESVIERFEHLLRRIENSKSRGKDSGNIDFAADALTLAGLFAASEKTHEGDSKALRWFRRAFEIGSAAESSAKTTSPPTDEGPNRNGPNDTQGGISQSLELPEDAYFDPNWQWKVSFALNVGMIHMKRGNLELARQMFRMAAYDLDNRMGYYKLAELLEKTGQADNKEYTEALEKAAVSGSQEAARKLAAVERDRAAVAGLGNWERRKSEVLAEEWMAIAA